MSKKNKGNNVVTKIALADELFSILVRLKGMDDTGHCQCFTCGKYYHFSNIDCGHYISRKSITTRWMEENARPQCTTCNRGHYGQYDIFKASLEENHPGITEYLERLSRETANLTRSDMNKIIETLKKRIKDYGGVNSVPKK